jgi:hypothetical protein
LRYVRDTLVAAEGFDISKVVESSQPIALHRVLASVPGTPLGLQDRALEVLHRLPATPRLNDPQGLRTELLSTIAGLRADLAAVSSRTYPDVVVCRGSGIGHWTANSVSTHCGWQWACNPQAYTAAQAGFSGRICKRCAKHVDAQVGNGEHLIPEVDLASPSGPFGPGAMSPGALGWPVASD